jgi:hypothetical protein
MSSGRETAPMSTLSSHSTQLASSAKVSFWDLPRKIRNDIYTLPHPLYLFQEPGSRVESFAPDRPFRWIALLYTNRQIYHEASAALYRMNCFHLVDTTEQQFGLLQAFFNCIGPVHAASLSNLCINSPVLESIDDQPGQFNLGDDSLQSIRLLQEMCTNLSTLETLVHSKNDGLFRKPDKLLQEAVLSIDAQFKLIRSLERIIVRVAVRDGIPTASAKDVMQRLGWVVVCDKRCNGRELVVTKTKSIF